MRLYKWYRDEKITFVYFLISEKITFKKKWKTYRIIEGTHWTNKFNTKNINAREDKLYTSRVNGLNKHVVNYSK